MKQSILILGIILFSLIGGGIGAFGVMNFLELPYNIPSHEEIKLQEITNSEKEDSQKIPEKQVNLVSLENSINQVVKTVAPSIVSIVIKKDLVVYRSDPWGFFQQPAGTVSRKVGGGSGFFVRDNGIIITNKHVVQDTQAEYTVILNTGEEYDATVIALDPVNDLAIIKITDEAKTFSTLPLVQNLDEIDIGDFGIAVGNALAEFQNSVSLGIISGKDRSIEAGGESLSGLLQTDAAINPGNSGGPLINLSGEVVGINTAIASNSNGIGFAYGLTQQRVDYMLKSIEESGRIMRPFIGVNYIPNSPGVASELGLKSSEGVYIIDDPESIIPGSSAESAGLEPGDIILSIDNNMLNSRNSLGNIIQNSLPGDILSLEIIRKNGASQTLELELGAY